MRELNGIHKTDCKLIIRFKLQEKLQETSTINAEVRMGIIDLSRRAMNTPLAGWSQVRKSLIFPAKLNCVFKFQALGSNELSFSSRLAELEIT